MALDLAQEVQEAVTEAIVSSVPSRLQVAVVVVRFRILIVLGQMAGLAAAVVLTQALRLQAAQVELETHRLHPLAKAIMAALALVAAQQAVVAVAQVRQAETPLQVSAATAATAPRRQSRVHLSLMQAAVVAPVTGRAAQVARAAVGRVVFRPAAVPLLEPQTLVAAVVVDTIQQHQRAAPVS